MFKGFEGETSTFFPLILFEQNRTAGVVDFGTAELSD
jgi:hypothetical protein